jgi:endonuclease YncB( thermonuclease family)
MAGMRSRTTQSGSIFAKAEMSQNSCQFKAFPASTPDPGRGGEAVKILAPTLTGRVVRVTDGDTIVVLDSSDTQHKIRLTGIDAPERKQAFGTKSKEHLSDSVAGRFVVVDYDKRDRYERILGKVLLNGEDMNLEQVRAGLAWHYKKDMVTRGWCRVSRRELDPVESTEWHPVTKGASEQKLKSGEIVPVDIALYPSSTFFSAGEILQLILASDETIPSPPYKKDASFNLGKHLLHFGGEYDSYLLVPKIPSKAE